MKKLLSALLGLIAAFSLHAQVKCYKGDFQSLTDLRYRIENGQLYLQTSTFRETELYFIAGNVVYFGRKGDYQYPVYTFDNNKIYKGNSTMGTDLLFTLYENGIYPGSSTMYSDCLYTIRNGKVFRAKSETSFDILLSMDKATLSNEELFLLIAAILPY